MKLTRYSDYSLRVSLYLAMNTDRLVSITEIVDTYGIPRGNVMKLVTDLVRAEIFESVRGRSGGIRLAKPPAEVTVATIVVQTEGDAPLVDCSNCILSPGCILTCVLKEAKQAFFETLERYSLQDLIDKDTGSLAILGTENRKPAQG